MLFQEGEGDREKGRGLEEMRERDMGCILWFARPAKHPPVSLVSRSQVKSIERGDLNAEKVSREFVYERLLSTAMRLLYGHFKTAVQRNKTVGVVACSAGSCV